MNQKKTSIEAIYPLSPMQQGMLFHSLYAPQSGVYFVQTEVTFVGKLNCQAFKLAWQEVVARHPVLRTLFVWQQGQKPLQVVLKKVELPWTEQDWRLYKEPEEQLSLYLAAERSQGFELDRAPLMRFALMQISDESYYFVWNQHHLLLDGWSTPLVLQEVWAAYHAACRGERLSITRSRPYKDYIVWLTQQDLAQAQAYWRQALQGFTAPTSLAVDHRARLNDHDQAAYSEHQLYFSEETSAALQKMARENRLTINTLIQGAWALLLSRYSGEEDVLFGATVSGRPAELSGVEKMVGLFINTLPVRVNVPADLSLLAWLSDLQEQQREREQYAYTPLVDIQGWSDIPRGTPLFESLLVYENYPVNKESLQEKTLLQVTDMRSVEQTNYPLTLVAALSKKEDGVQLYLAFSYDTNRFEHDTISRMAGHLQTLLSGMIADPYQPIAMLPLLSEAEKHQLLVEWNDTAADYPSDKCIHQLFEEQVERTPEAIAVVFEDQAVTYRELNAKANQLAHYLIEQGVGLDAPVRSDMLVGICVPRDLSMVVALLGILKAGGAYVPLDPSYPKERLEFMLEDANVKVLLTTSELLAILAHDALTVCLDRPLPINQSTNPNRNHESSQLAYVLYTSGSTGRPKGVAIEHRSAVALLSWAATIFGPDSLMGVLASTSISFDLSVFELFLPLSRGGKVILAENALALPTLEDVVLVNTVPSAMKELVRGGAIPNSVRVVNLAGEPLKNQLVQQIYQNASVRQVFNLYGPSEDTTYSTYVLTKKDAQSEPTIGRPISNTQSYILDAHLQLVPIGVPGELHLGGVGLARGYLNRPQLIKEKFIPNPFGLGHLYKTGDLCRYLPDGNIEFIGRIDHQVKIRGFRIELGEIEAVARKHEAVREVVVIVREEATDKRLVAYVVCEQSVENSILQAYLKEKLPDYMVPSAFVQLEALPLTPNGKVNRRALPAPTRQSQLETAYVEPSTDTEQQIVAVWEEVLQVEKVGIHDNFFELGGHSLLIIHLHHRLQGMYEQPLAITDLFKYPTVHSLARYVSQPKKKIESDQVAESRTSSRRTRKTTAKERRQLRQKHRSSKQ